MEFNREPKALPIIYDPIHFLPIKQYRLTKPQIKFLITIEKYIAGLNPVSTMDDIHDDFIVIKNILNRSMYREEQISILLKIRERYKFLYGYNIKVQNIVTDD